MKATITIEQTAFSEKELRMAGMLVDMTRNAFKEAKVTFDYNPEEPKQ